MPWCEFSLTCSLARRWGLTPCGLPARGRGDSPQQISLATVHMWDKQTSHKMQQSTLSKVGNQIKWTKGQDMKVKCLVDISVSSCLRGLPYRSLHSGFYVRVIKIRWAEKSWSSGLIPRHFFVKSGMALLEYRQPALSCCQAVAQQGKFSPTQSEL